MPKSDGRSFRISGLVVDARTERGVEGLRVEAWDDDLLLDDLVGSAVTDANGAFEIGFEVGYFHELFFDRTPDLYFKVLRGDEVIVNTRGEVHWNARAGEIPVTIPVRQAGAETTFYTVEGAVFSRERGGVGGLRVQVVDKNVGADVPLAAAVTDERGRYRARFSAPSLAVSGKQRPDLQARVYAGQEFLAASEVRYDAGEQETLSVRLPASAAALPSEYESLTRALAAHYGGALGDLEESGERQDITYLANKSGWDARAVALAALAEQFGRRDAADADADIHPAFYYALFRAGLPADPDTLYRADTAKVARVWAGAVERGVIPHHLNGEVGKAAEAFGRLAAGRALDARPLAGVSTLKEMLDLTLGQDERRQRQFAELHTRHRRDLPAFWGEVRRAFGEETERQLRLDGQLGFLTLDNAPLIRSLRDAERAKPITSALDLARRGYFRPQKWERLIEGAVPVRVPGATPDARRSNYAALLAAQVRLSFPTAVIAEQVRGGELRLAADVAPGAPDADAVRGGVYDFLAGHQGSFEIGMHPVEQYLARAGAGVKVAPPVREELKRLQRVYQLTPGDEAMKVLLADNLDSAYRVVRFDEQEFVRSYGGKMGERNARSTYQKSQQVHNAVLNIITSYATSRGAPLLGADPSSPFIDPRYQFDEDGGSAPHADDIIAYPTLEQLFGSMDYCACEHCRSILSPAAYMVDLLLFIDRPTNAGQNPLDVLLGRRPDIQFLKLTCENTNTPLPYIDVVNETLEYFVANDISLDDYEGHDTGNEAAADELLASPQFVDETVYNTLKAASFPPPLPFHNALETLRRYFERFEFPLHEAMETLRRGEALERPDDDSYGWRDVHMERLRLSRAEYALLTDGALTLRELYGYPSGKTEEQVADELSSVNTFTRRIGVTYEELVEILKTRFVNPGLALIPRLERLGVSLTTLKEFKDGKLTDAEFDARLPKKIKPAKYGGNIKAWVKSDKNYDLFMGLITIANPTAEDDLCNFDNLGFRYADPDPENNRLRRFEFVRLLRFIRLWKKLGWSIEQTDKAITALYPSAHAPQAGDPEGLNLDRLDAGFLVLLPRLGVALDVMGRLKLSAQKDLPGLLALWSAIDTAGPASLYRKMFFSPPPQERDEAFADDGYGDFLKDNKKVMPHAETLRAAFSLTGDEFSQLVNDVVKGINAKPLVPPPLTPETLPLTLTNISAIYRRGWLARKLRLSVREFLLLTEYARLDPFAKPDIDQAPPDQGPPPIIRLLQLVEVLKAASLKPEQALYLIWNQDISGQSAPAEALVTGVARALRSDFAAIEAEYVVADDPNGDIARARMSLVYDAEAATAFFGLLGDALFVGVPYTHPQPALQQAILAAARQRLVYDAARNRLSYIGIMRTATRDALKSVAGVPAAFPGAVDALYAANQAALDLFFERGDRLAVEVSYAHPQATLEQAILDAAPGRIKYDDAQQRLSYVGFLGTAARDALKSVAGVPAAFPGAVDALYAANQEAIAQSFPRGLGGTLAVETHYSQTEPGLTPEVLDVAPGRISYDDFRKRLLYAGVLDAETREALEEAEGVSAEFKAAVQKLYEANRQVVRPFFARYPELRPLYLAYAESTDPPERKRTQLLENFLPGLKRRRKHQQALAATAASARTDPAFTRAVLNDAKVLHAAAGSDKPALEDLTALETPGLSVEFFWGDTAGDTADDNQQAAHALDYPAAVALPANPTPGGLISGVWSGHLDVPESGFYNISVETEPGASVSLRIDGQAVALGEDGNVWSNQDALSLTAGTLHALTLTVEGVREKLSVSWETAGRGREVIPSRYLYPAALVGNLRQAYTRFLKAAALAAGLKLTANEFAHLAAREEYEIGGLGWLNALPVAGDPTPLTARALRSVLTALLDFARLKAALAPDDERLLALLRDPGVTLPNGDSLLLTVTGWEGGSLEALLERFFSGGTSLNHLRSPEKFRRVHDAYELVTAVGVPAPALIAAATNEPTSTEVMNFQSALRARYDEADWLSVLRPTNDELRALRRDALVAYVLRRLKNDPETLHLDTPDKLYEYFLMDVQMEPCMQTSRVRHALSSVQLFIERCLMNLERGVAPSSIKADQWAWMKRYRVWEANRKIFLWPENWLEPELRDDQSPFFKEMMGVLLQSDITEDAAASAMLDYLAKLEEVAKLEPCGIHYAEGDPGTADDVAHVVARTAGANRKYYYRKRDGGSWTPWEQIGLDIKADPVAPVLWKDRIFLFWLRILTEATDAAQTGGSSSGGGGNIANKTLGEIKSVISSGAQEAMKAEVRAVLCWSEFYNGKWQAEKTSDVNHPARLGRYQSVGSNAFQPRHLGLTVYEEWIPLNEHEMQTRPGDSRFQQEKLAVATQKVLRLDVLYANAEKASFRFYNTHSLPEVTPPEDHPLPYSRFIQTGSKTLSILYEKESPGPQPIGPMPPLMTSRLLKAKVEGRAVEPRHDLDNHWDAPFFYEDNNHVFYVTTAEKKLLIPEFGGFVVDDSAQPFDPGIPPVYHEIDPLWRIPKGDPVFEPGEEFTNPVARFVSEDAHVHTTLTTNAPVHFGDKLIGPSGALPGSGGKI
jgi:hypothetical protein